MNYADIVYNFMTLYFADIDQGTDVTAFLTANEPTNFMHF